jgi:hypothetical protein
MSRASRPGAGRTAPAPPPAGRLDAQILAIWQALLLNPDLDPRHARHAIDRLLDQRAGRTAPAPPAPPQNRTPPSGSPAQRAVLAEVLALLLGSPG